MLQVLSLASQLLGKVKGVNPKVSINFGPVVSAEFPDHGLEDNAAMFYT